jgi:tRNA/rRNA methyltransferase
MNNSVFQRVKFVLVETSHPGNIGAVARAMKTMGFKDLVLVSPRFENALSDPEAIAFASGALNVLDSAQIVSSIEEALYGCNYVAAISARLRHFSPPIASPRDFSHQIQANEGLNVALVFGNERFGLPNAIVENANVLINIPANPEYSSLNLAQAVQVLAYECRMGALKELNVETEVGFQGVLATQAEVNGMMTHLEQALIKIKFLDPIQPKKLMSRLKRLFSRTQLEVEEVNILRGISKKILDQPTADNK